MKKNLTNEEIQILKAISHNHEGRFQDFIRWPREKLDRIFTKYRQTEPVLNDLKNHGIEINDLEDPLYSDFPEESLIKSVPILVEWLKQESLPSNVYAAIINILIEKPISKQYAFNAILNLYKSVDLNDKDEWGYKTDLPMMLGNALRRWADDDHADAIFDLLTDEKLRRHDFLLSSLSNFKEPKNKKRATQILIQQLQKPNLPNTLLGTIISTLRTLKAVEARDLIESFTNFPKNYKRTIEITPKEHAYVTDKQIQSEAKKTIKKFDKLKS